MATLNQIAANIADALKKPFDNMFIERVKFAVRYWRADLLRQDFERNGFSRDVLGSFVMKLIKVDKFDSCVVESGCTVLRSENKIPKPVRIKGGSLFHYVGSPDINISAWVETDTNELRFTKFNRYTNNVTRYIYINDYIYVYTDKLFKYIKLEYIASEPEKMKEACIADCVTDDDEYPIPLDLLVRITNGLIRGELTIMVPDNEITINPNQTHPN